MIPKSLMAAVRRYYTWLRDAIGVGLERGVRSQTIGKPSCLRGRVCPRSVGCLCRGNAVNNRGTHSGSLAGEVAKALY